MANLKIGSSGEEVKKLQEKLIAEGYDVGSTKADGIYGKNTAAAVKEYQQKNGLAVDGIAGVNTQGKLFGAADQPTSDVPATPPATNPPADAPAAAPEAGFSHPEFSYDTYAPSDTVTQANTILQQHSENKPGAYQSKWDGMIQDYINQIKNREKFSYDVNSDALYQQYRDLYAQQGQMAMMDTMGQAAAMTGGYGNSYAQTAGQQMYGQYLGKLNEIVPELYQQAYNRYTQEGQDLYNLYGLAMDQENMDYSRYQDGMNLWQSEQDRLQNNYNAEREFDYGKYEGDRALAYDAYSGDRSMAYNSYLEEYNRKRDQIQDSQWQAEFDEDKRRADRAYEDSQKVTYTGGSDTGDKGTEYVSLTEADEKRWDRLAAAETSTDRLDALWGRMEREGVHPEDIEYILGPYYEKLSKPKPGKDLVPQLPYKGTGGTGSGTMYLETR